MYSTAAEHSAWTLGTQAGIPPQTSLHKFSLTLAPCSGRCPFPRRSPPGALVHLCFVIPLGWWWWGW